MGKLKYSSSVTRRDFLARSGRLASAAPAVTLLLSSASISNAGISLYVITIEEFPVLREPADSDTTETPVPFPNTGQSSGSDTPPAKVKVDGQPA